MTLSAAASIRVEAISSPQDFEEFARLPFAVYAEREAWWPPDIRNEVDLLAGRTRTAPFLDLQPFCAWREGRLVARVSAVVNRRYIEHWGEQLGQLIHFEAIAGEDEAVAEMLTRALEWLARRGMRFARSGFAAFLDYPYAIDNYGDLPSFLLRGNPDYYHRYLKDAGFETEKGHIDYTAALTPETLARYTSMVEAIRSAGITVLSWREYGFLAAADAWTDVTNAAFARHWGWNPITRTEVRPMMAPLHGSLVSDLSMVAVAGREPVGVVFSVPDLSPVLAQLRPGVKLHPERGGGTRGALINIGVVEAARGRGTALAMAARSFLTMARHGMRYTGYTLVLDDNWPSRRTAMALGAHVSGNFVTYRRAL
ncbi:MAG TPA: hypothetical protein VFB33_12645 [Candidatus Binataceae bacterium]|nr:hypothetical protein [Candidatus Binataceae bacterium]